MNVCVSWGCHVTFESTISLHITSAYHYDDVIMSAIASQITSLTIVYSIVYSDADQRKHQSSASLAFVWGIHRGPVNSPHKWPVTRKMFPFDDVIMTLHGFVSSCDVVAAARKNTFSGLLNIIKTILCDDKLTNDWRDMLQLPIEFQSPSLNHVTA